MHRLTIIITAAVALVVLAVSWLSHSRSRVPGLAANANGGRVVEQVAAKSVVGAPGPRMATLPAPSRDLGGSDDVLTEQAVATTSNPEDAPPLGTNQNVAATDQAPRTPRWDRFSHDTDRYMLEVVAPRARACWKTLEGNSKIEFQYTLRHETGVGVGRVSPVIDDGADLPVMIVESGLTTDQTARALDCMLDAVDGTSYTTELPSDKLGPIITKYQTWNVGQVGASD